jgi:hypothetical protein
MLWRLNKNKKDRYFSGPFYFGPDHHDSTCRYARPCVSTICGRAYLQYVAMRIYKTQTINFSSMQAAP